MTYDPKTGMTTDRDREVIVTPSGTNYGGIAMAAVLVVLAILFVVWLFGSTDGGTTGTTTELDDGVVTTAPIETTAPVETTAPADTTPTTAAP
jgi:hypothetical protein